MLGILSPQGEFYECEYWGHKDLADNLCKNFYEYKPDWRYFDSIKFLTNNNWIIIYSRDVGKSNYDFSVKPPKPIYTTDEQKAFIDANADKLNNPQMEALDKIFSYEYLMLQRGE